MDRLDNDGGIIPPETQNQSAVQNKEQVKAGNSKKMEDRRAGNEEKDKTEEGLLLAIDGAKIKFNAHLGTFKVLNDVPTTQDKLTGTVVEKQIPNFIFDDGFILTKPTEWQNFGSAKVQNNEVLLKKSILPGVGAIPGTPPETGKVEFVDSGQVNMPESIDTTGAPVPNKIEVLKKFIIHFRRNTSYKGEFGFDWMRDEYIYPITNVGGTNKELSLDPVKLKTEYKTTDVLNPVSPYGKDYYCSFLNLMLNQEAELDLEVEELEALSSGATEVVFESSNSDLTITPSSIPLNTLISGGKQTKSLGGTTTRNFYLATNQVKIKCNKAFIKNEQIKVFAKLKDPVSGIEDKKEVGKMMVMKNSDQSKYTINVYVIKSYITDDPNFGESVIDANINRKGGLQAFEDYLNQQSLNQGLIQVKFNYDSTGKPYDWAFRKASIKNASSESKYQGMLIDEMKMKVDTGKYMNYINDRFKLMFPQLTRKKGIFLYLTPLFSPGAGGAAYNVPLNNKHCIIFNENLGHLESYAHEIGHTLGLEHFFLDGARTVDQEIQDVENKKRIREQEKNEWFRVNAVQYVGKPELKREHEKVFDVNISHYSDQLNVLKKNVYRFIKKTTENIMDYDLNNQKSFDKWQWQVISEEVKQYYHE